jgi:molybdopterin converting factor subunit 1
MTVTVLLFASYAEKLGFSSTTVELPAGSTVDTLLEAVRGMPGASSLPPAPLVAVNENYARAGTVLANGDEVAIIPPVAGG